MFPGGKKTNSEQLLRVNQLNGGDEVDVLNEMKAIRKSCFTTVNIPDTKKQSMKCYQLGSFNLQKHPAQRKILRMKHIKRQTERTEVFKAAR